MTFNVRDFRRIITRPMKGGERLRHAGLLALSCSRARAADRIRLLYETIVSEHALAEKAGVSFIMEIDNGWYRVDR